MSTPQKLRNALEIYFGPHDSEIKTEILDVLELHFGQRQDQQQIIREIVSAASPWVFSHDAQPEVGVEVICLDLNPLDGSVDVNTATRGEGSDWTDPECRFWWMHIPPLPEGGDQACRKSGESRMDVDLVGGDQTLDVGAFMGWDVHHSALADAYAESEAAVAALRAQCAPHKDIQTAENAAEAARAALLEHARAILALHNQNTNKEGSHA